MRGGLLGSGGSSGKARTRFAGTVALVLGLFVAGQSWAQDAAPMPRPNPQSKTVPQGGTTLRTAAKDSLDPSGLITGPVEVPGVAPRTNGRPQSAAINDTPVDVALDPHLADGGPSLKSGVVWRVFAPSLDATGRLPLVAQAEGGLVHVTLKPGTYYVHAAYGRAGASEEMRVSAPGQTEVLVLNAGALKLAAVVGKDTPLPKNLVTFDVYTAGDEESDRTLVISNGQAGSIFRLNAGTYNVVSRYGDANAVIRADIRVAAGKLTEATVQHKAARVTLKLVADHGGEALANTAWTVQTPSGESVFDSVGAFPTVVLAAGDYIAVAKHLGKIYQANITIEADLNRDIEVLAK